MKCTKVLNLADERTKIKKISSLLYTFLISHLLTNGLYVCGTIRTYCKGFPNDPKQYIQMVN